MRIIDEVDIQAAVTFPGARDAVHAAFCTFANGQAVTPQELAMKLAHGGEVHVKGAYLGGDVLAFKVATGQFPDGRNSGFTSVVDAATGQPTAILQDRGWLTEMRTAAASAVSAQALARSDSSTLAILGGGIQAAFQVAALRDACDLNHVTVWSRSTETAKRFADGNDATAAASIAEAVSDADIIVCCTPSQEPLLSRELIKPGTHVIAVGADMVGKREVASDLVAAAEVLVCDSVAVGSHVGELQHVPEHVHRAVDLGDVLTGRAPGRINESQISLVDLCGLGIQDAAMAQLVMAG